METNKQTPGVPGFSYIDSRFLGELLSGTSTIDNLTAMIENINEGKNHIETARTLLSSNGTTVSYVLLSRLAGYAQDALFTEGNKYWYKLDNEALKKEALNRLVAYLTNHNEKDLHYTILHLMIMYVNKIENTSE